MDTIQVIDQFMKKNTALVCQRCHRPCETYTSRSRIFGVQQISECCKAPAKAREA